MQWGRSGQSAVGLAPRRRPRHGVWSILLAMLALILAGGAATYLANLPSDAPDWTADPATFYVVTGFLAVAPVLHLVGIVVGVIGLARGAVASSVLGILLNLLLVGVGGYFAYIAFGAAAAFT